jgi:A/G-specific adenine glycosylase
LGLRQAASRTCTNPHEKASKLIDQHSVAKMADDIGAIRAALLAWFAQAGRDLPWRHTRDPYRIMVSEIMLQQTQVDRVIPKYRAFLDLFPTIEALADAPTAEVIRAWAGLGYNRRAVNMQRTARAVLQDYGGQFPRDLADLRKLPGIGPYTAGAIACFAFEQDVGFMDTNIRRVIQRLFVGPEEYGTAAEARLLALAQAAVPGGQGWAWNQAIMELGALICTAAAPACWRCPVHHFCRA